MDRIAIWPEDVASRSPVARGVVGLPIPIVNVFAAGDRSRWTLVDGGLYGSAGRIRGEACEGSRRPTDGTLLRSS